MHMCIILYCIYYIFIYVVAVSWKYYSKSNIIMSISLIRIPIISVHVWRYSCCYIFLFYSSVYIKYIDAMYGICI